MSTLSTVSTSVRELASPLTGRLAGRRQVQPKLILILLGIATTAIGLRLWGINATLATSDQAALPWMLQYSFGVKWIFAHDYGPTLPLLERTWVELLSRMHLPVDEAAIRAPIAAASLLQVLITFALLRRLGASRGTALLGMLVASTTPALVTDAHYCWGYATLWLLTGSVALWATLGWFDERRAYWLMLAGAALTAHCLSNCYAFALPATLLLAWLSKYRHPQPESMGQPRERSMGCAFAWLCGYGMPCAIALAVIILSWRWTGAGQLGRLLFKHHAGSTGLQFMQVLELPRMWAVQFGYLFGVVACAGLVAGTVASDRRRLIAFWCWASLVPLVLLVDWRRVGYPAEYMIEAAYAGGLLAVLGIARAYQGLSSRPRLRVALAGAAGAALLHMGAGAADACLQDGRLAGLTGVRTGWGSIKPESGIKAAGWYVRRFVPADAVVMSTHTNTGMEAPVAEYYLGRHVLAGYDLRPDMIGALVRSMQGGLDVLIVEPHQVWLADSMVGFERVATFRHGSEPVRCVYARQSLGLTRIDGECASLNARYDRDCRAPRVPEVLAAPAAFLCELGHYQRVVRRLRAQPPVAVPGAGG